MILIIDFGSQVTQLIARRVREMQVYSEIVPFQKAAEYLKSHNPDGIILSGGPASVRDDNAPTAPQDIFDTNIPILGICYGQQTICQQNGGLVESSKHREFGRADIKIIKDSLLFQDIGTIGDSVTVWMSHGDAVTKIPNGFDVVAVSHGAPFAVIEHRQKKIYAVQFPSAITEPVTAYLRRKAKCTALQIPN